MDLLSLWRTKNRLSPQLAQKAERTRKEKTANTSKGTELHRPEFQSPKLCTNGGCIANTSRFATELLHFRSFTKRSDVAAALRCPCRCFRLLGFAGRVERATTSYIQAARYLRPSCHHKILVRKAYLSAVTNSALLRHFLCVSVSTKTTWRGRHPKRPHPPGCGPSERIPDWDPEE